jgi:peptide deformylase
VANLDDGGEDGGEKGGRQAAMTRLEVLQYPDRRLKQVSEPVAEITDELRALAHAMCEVMYGEPGIGLAAPQIGRAIRLLVVDTEWTEEGAERNPIIMVNPELIEREGSIKWDEGCLSVPDFTAEVERSARVVLRYSNLDGKDVTEEADGLRAVCFQHEIDHLDGILFIDRISRLKRSMYATKRKKQLRLEQEDESTSLDGNRF